MFWFCHTRDYKPRWSLNWTGQWTQSQLISARHLDWLPFCPLLGTPPINRRKSLPDTATILIWCDTKVWSILVNCFFCMKHPQVNCNGKEAEHTCSHLAGTGSKKTFTIDEKVQSHQDCNEGDFTTTT